MLAHFLLFVHSFVHLFVFMSDLKFHFISYTALWLIQRPIICIHYYYFIWINSELVRQLNIKFKFYITWRDMYELHLYIGIHFDEIISIEMRNVVQYSTIFCTLFQFSVHSIQLKILFKSNGILVSSRYYLLRQIGDIGLSFFFLRVATKSLNQITGKMLRRFM